jgi:hypothetical protein
MELPPTLSGAERAQRVERFQREARAALRMSHPNIVQTYEAGQDKGLLFVAMEYLEGKSLAKVLREEGKLSLEKATSILSQMCGALTYAHSRGVVHRDVKPSNVMIQADGKVKLTDFGIARIHSDPRMTVEGQTLGTPYYMSPEQVKGKDVTSASDIFSCAVVFYEMVTGGKPFEGANIAEIGLKIVEGEPDFPPEIPRPVVGVLKKALAKYPAARYATAEEFAAAVMKPPAWAGEAIPSPASLPVSPLSPVAAKALDWTPKQAEVAWKRAQVAAVAIGLFILGVSLPTIYREHKQVSVVKEVEGLLSEAQAAARKGLWDEALRESETALGKVPAGSPSLWRAWAIWKQIRLDYANWCLKASRPWDAIRSAQEVVERGWDDAEAHLLMGKAYLIVGNEAFAKRELEASAAYRDAAAQEARQLLSRLDEG